MKPRRGKTGRWRPGRLLICAALGVVLATALLVLPLRWLPPLTSTFMIRTWLVGLDDNTRFRYDWVSRGAISASLPAAVLAAEDQRFFEHVGFDFQAIERAWQGNKKSRALKGASTITQQVAKNLYLWPGRSWLRKACEAWFTLWLETALPKQRILEIYLNIAQFGPKVFGVEAASRLYFGKSAVQLNRHEAALLAAVLPAPEQWRVSRPSAYVRQRQDWILTQSLKMERSGRFVRSRWASG